MKKDHALSLMKAPGDYRRGIWRGRVIQIKITNVCTLDCANCTAAVGIAKALQTKDPSKKRMWFMSVEQFETAIKSLKGFGGVIGLFGGNPCVHPEFKEICEIFAREIPDIDQRGLWSNDLKNHGELCRATFSPNHSNLNVHRGAKAYEYMAKTWPEAIEARREMMMTGLRSPSMHGSWWNAMMDVIPDEGERWMLISKCFVNQTWSAEITVIDGQLKAFFCEFAATRAEFADILTEPNVGLDVTEGWWSQPIGAFEQQICHHCHRCGAPLNPVPVEDLGEKKEDYTRTNALLFEKAKRGQEIKNVESSDGAATKYLGDAVMPVHLRKHE